MPCLYTHKQQMLWSRHLLRLKQIKVRKFIEFIKENFMLKTRFLFSYFMSNYSIL